MSNPLLIFLNGSSPYGANLSILALADQLIGQTPMLFIMPAHGEMERLLTEKGISYKIIPFKEWVYYKWKSRNQIFRFGRNILWFTKGILVHLHNYVLLRKHISFFRSFDSPIVMSNSASIDFGYRLSTALNAKHIWHLREYLDLDYSLHFYFGKKHALRKINRSRGKIAVSESIEKHFMLQSGVVLYDGFSISENMTAPTIKEKEKFKFLILGLIRENKGHEDALKAFSCSEVLKKSASLMVVGSGNSKWLNDLIGDYHLEDFVEFLGYRKDIDEVFESCHVLLMCSRNEAMGRVTIESMLHKRPVIGKASGGTQELINNDYTGYLYKDIDELRQRMEVFVKEPKLLTELGENAYNLAKTKYSMNIYVKNIKDYVAQV